MAGPLKIPQLKTQENEWFLQELYPHEPMLRSWLSSRFSANSDFEDHIQDAYVRTLKRHRKKHLATPKAFLFATARNLCIDSLRRGKVVRFEPLTELDSQGVWDQTKASTPRFFIASELITNASLINSGASISGLPVLSTHAS